MALNITEALLQCELFEKFTEEEIQLIATLCQTKNYEMGENIFRQGDRGSKIYIVMDGQVTLERSVDLGNRKAKIPIITLGRGRAFGCWSTFLGEPYNLMSSAVCIRQSHIISMEGAQLRTALKNNPRAGFKVMERLVSMLGDRVRGIYGAIEKI